MISKHGSPSPARPEWTSQRAFIISSVAAGSGVGVVVGMGGAALIAWLLPRRAMIEEMASGWWQTGTIAKSIPSRSW